MKFDRTTIYVIFGCLLLAISNISLWATSTLFNQEVFVQQFVTGVQTEASTQALAGAVVDRISEQYPRFPQIARNPAEEIVVWVLQRPISTSIFERTATVVNRVMTTSAQDAIGIDVTNVSANLVGVVSAISPEIGTEVESAFESALASKPIVVYENGRFPALRTWADNAPWVWPLSALAAILIFAVAYFESKNRSEALLIIGIGIVITGILTLVTIPAIYPPVLNNVANFNLQIVVRQVLDALTSSLQAQSIILACIGGFVMLFSRFGKFNTSNK